MGRQRGESGIQTAVRAETRARRIAQLVEMLARGETIHFTQLVLGSRVAACTVLPKCWLRAGRERNRI
jgi:Bacteriocin-protection, YdeI or OmpD-Associated